jgi:hypothetical protein
VAGGLYAFPIGHHRARSPQRRGEAGEGGDRVGRAEAMAFATSRSEGAAWVVPCALRGGLCWGAPGCSAGTGLARYCHFRWD